MISNLISRTKSMHCPKCNAEVDAATNANNSGKSCKSGDISLCIYCGCAGIYVDKDGNTEPTEIIEMSNEAFEALDPITQEAIRYYQSCILLLKATNSNLDDES